MDCQVGRAFVSGMCIIWEICVMRRFQKEDPPNVITKHLNFNCYVAMYMFLSFVSCVSFAWCEDDKRKISQTYFETCVLQSFVSLGKKHLGSTLGGGLRIRYVRFCNLYIWVGIETGCAKARPVDMPTLVACYCLF